MIDKVGGVILGVILKDKKILVQRKKNNREECIIPGGKREENETDFETLKRELDEELDVELLNAEFLGAYDDIACFSDEPIHVQTYLAEISFSDEPIHVQTYLAEIKGRIKCKNEIKEAIWIDKNYKEKGIKVGSILGEYVIPNLIERGLM